jgi:hypothetical protein
MNLEVGQKVKQLAKVTQSGEGQCQDSKQVLLHPCIIVLGRKEKVWSPPKLSKCLLTECK